MSKHNDGSIQPEMPLNEARDQKAVHLKPVAPDGDAPPDAQMPPEDEEVLHHVLPSRQRYARAFLAGKTPGLQQRLAPNAAASDVEGWVEDDETVARLAQWHREAPHG